MKLRLPANQTLMVWSCVLSLVGLVLMLWSVFSPTVWPIMVAISVGQAVGTVSFVLFLAVVARDLHVERVLRKGTREDLVGEAEAVQASYRGED